MYSQSKTSWVEEGNGLKMVGIQIDLEIDYLPAPRFHFVMRRVPGSKSVVVSGPKVLAEPEGK